MIESIDPVIEKLDKIALEKKVSTEELRRTVIKQGYSLKTLNSQVKSIMQDSTKSYPIGNLNGKELKLDKESLAIIDRLIAAQLLQLSFSDSESKGTILAGSTGILSDGIRKSLDKLAASVADGIVYAYDGTESPEQMIGNQINQMFSNIGEGIRANRDTMTGLGGAMMSVGAFVTVVPGGQVAGPLIAAAGALMWFTALHANTAILMATDTAADGYLGGETNFERLKRDVGEYLEEVYYNGLGTVIGEVSPKGGFIIDTATVMQQSTELLNKFNKDREKTYTKPEPKKPDTGTDTPAYLLMVGADGEGSITSIPAGISCPGDCTELYNAGSTIILTAKADEGYEFTGWSGDCSGTGSCQITIGKDTATIGYFKQKEIVPSCANPQQCPSGNIRCCMGNWECCEGDRCAPPGWC